MNYYTNNQAPDSSIAEIVNVLASTKKDDTYYQDSVEKMNINESEDHRRDQYSTLSISFRKQVKADNSDLQGINSDSYVKTRQQFDPVNSKKLNQRLNTLSPEAFSKSKMTQQLTFGNHMQTLN